jgi:xanthine dehydrogenase molybdopterin-binding subunit B
MAHLTVYDDGTVLVIHGGCDPGTGVNTKVAQAIAITLGIPYDTIRVGESNTDITPKTGWNGGSTGIESQVEAARLAALKIKERLEPYKLKLSQSDAEPKKEPTWKEIVAAATADNMNQTITEYFMGIGSKNEFVLPQLQISRSDYFTWGVGCSEVEVDILTGEIRIIRSDMFTDAGNSLNPLIDIGQAEGAFVFGLSYYLQEEELNSSEGKPLYASTWTYKPYLGVDIPNDFRVALAENTTYPANIMGFKGIGEPPMVLSYTAVGALNQAIMASRVERGLNPWCEYSGPIGIDRRALAGELSQKDLVF